MNKKIKLTTGFKRYNKVIVIVIITLFGVYFLSLTQAASSFISLEPENGVTSTAEELSDSSASGGKYVRFGAESEPNTSGRGPTGQWPAGFPDYDTPADITTSGSLASLQNALNSLGSSGGVIEHPGDIPEAKLDRPSGPEIVVRPPLGKRAEYTSAGYPIASNVLLAGWQATNLTIIGEPGDTVRNSGWAWCEGTKYAGLNVYGNGSDVEALYYEIVYREFADGAFSDRAGTRSTNNGRAVMTVVGSVITGSLTPKTKPDDPNWDMHADTLQTYFNSGGFGKISIRDSVIWPSYDKMYQGLNSSPLELDNVYTIAPSYAPQVYNGSDDISAFNNNDVYGLVTTGASIVRNSTFIGANNASAQLQIGNSEYYDLFSYHNYKDLGGNTKLNSIPPPPPTPSSTQLDTIWSP